MVYVLILLSANTIIFALFTSWHGLEIMAAPNNEEKNSHALYTIFHFGMCVANAIALCDILISIYEAT